MSPSPGFTTEELRWGEGLVARLQKDRWSQPCPEVHLVIASRGRAEVATTPKYWGHTKFCVSEEEAPKYAEYWPDVEIVAHPDSVLGVGPKVNWIMEKFGNVLPMSDDLGPLFWMGYAQGESIQFEDAQTAYDIVQHVARVAWDMGCYMFGVGHSGDIRNFMPWLPARMAGYMQGKTGFFAGSKLFLPDDPYCPYTDYFVSGLNAYYYRYMWNDNRWGCQEMIPDLRAEGGANEWRNLHHMERWTQLLVRYFGEAVTAKSKPESTRGRLAHPYAINLNVPW